ncbi:hypothetical protein ACVW0P_001231 [Mucilaginibacter sp. UYNi724]
MPLKIDKTNYEIYKKVYEVLWQYQLNLMQSQGLPSGLNLEELSPISVLNKWESKSQAIALKGLKAGFTDIVIQLANHPQESLHALDIELKAANLPGFFEISSELNGTLQKILKKQQIKKLEEYYLIVEILSDTTNGLAQQHTKILNEAIVAFELKQSKIIS